MGKTWIFLCIVTIHNINAMVLTKRQSFTPGGLGSTTFNANQLNANLMGSFNPGAMTGMGGSGFDMGNFGSPAFGGGSGSTPTGANGASATAGQSGTGSSTGSSSMASFGSSGGNFGSSGGFSSGSNPKWDGHYTDGSTGSTGGGGLAGAVNTLTGGSSGGSGASSTGGGSGAASGTAGSAFGDSSGFGGSFGGSGSGFGDFGSAGSFGSGSGSGTSGSGATSMSGAAASFGSSQGGTGTGSSASATSGAASSFGNSMSSGSGNAGGTSTGGGHESLTPGGFGGSNTTMDGFGGTFGSAMGGSSATGKQTFGMGGDGQAGSFYGTQSGGTGGTTGSQTGSGGVGSAVAGAVGGALGGSSSGTANIDPMKSGVLNVGGGDMVNNQGGFNKETGSYEPAAGSQPTSGKYNNAGFTPEQINGWKGRDGDMNNGVGGCCEGDGSSTGGSKTAQNMGWSSGNNSNIMGWAGSNGNPGGNSHGWVDENAKANSGGGASQAVDAVAEAAKAEVKALANCLNPVGMAMATKMLVDPRITLTKQHADNHTDEATAYQATLDWAKMLLTLPPSPPKRSSYSCPNRCPIPAPGLYGCPSVTVLKYIYKLAENGHITINDLCGGCHDCNSPHYAGDAVDLKKDMIRTSEFWVECQKMGGWFFDEGESLHCDFRAKKT